MPNELHDAVSTKKITGLAKVRKLIEIEELNVNEPHSVTGITVIDLAVQVANPEIIKYLIEKTDVDIDYSCGGNNLLFWALHNSPNVLKYIADPEKNLINRFNDGTTNFHAAVAQGNMNLVKSMLEENPRHIDSTNNKGQGAFFWCAMTGNLAMYYLLIQHTLPPLSMTIKDMDSMMIGNAYYRYIQSRNDLQEKKIDNAIVNMKIAIQSLWLIKNKTDDNYRELSNFSTYLENIYQSYEKIQSDLNNYRTAIFCREKIINKNNDDFEFLSKNYFKYATSLYNSDPDQIPETLINLAKSKEYSDKIVNKDETTLEKLKNAQQLIDLLQAKLNFKNISQKKKIDLIKQCSTWGFECKDVPRDGNCFFHAVVDQLNLIKNSELSRFTHENFREIITDYLKDNKEEYKDFIDEDFDNYIEKLKKNGTWVDHVTISAFAKRFNLTFAIINSDGSNINIIKLPNSIATLYLGYEVDLHYQSLRFEPNLNPSQSIQSEIEKSAFYEIKNTEEEKEMKSNLKRHHESEDIQLINSSDNIFSHNLFKKSKKMETTNLLSEAFNLEPYESINANDLNNSSTIFKPH